MRLRLRRLRIAIFVCLVGVGITLLYERQSAPPAKLTQEVETIGFVQSSNGFHLRQKADSQLWDPLQEGDAIYPRDQIKTGSQGELTIVLPTAGKTLDIESDSRLQLLASAKSISATTFDGLFNAIPRSEKASRNLKMIDSDGVTHLLTPNEPRSYIKDGQNSLREIDPRTEKLPSYKNIFWQYPSTLADSELNLELPVGMAIRWKGDHPDWSVQIEWGSARRKLTQKKLFPSLDHEARVLMPLGKNFWRWSVVNHRTGQVLFIAPASRMVVLPLVPPAIQYPAESEIVRSQRPTDPVILRWLAEKRFVSYEVLISEEPQMSAPLVTARNISQASLTFTPKRYGTYYWQIAGFEAGRKDPIRSKVHELRLLPKEIEKIQLSWVTPENSQQTFLGNEPTLNLKWTTPATGQYTYNLKVRPIDGELGRSVEKTIKTTEASVSVERAGVYQAIVEALNKDSDTVGVTAPLKVSIQLQPLLKPPTLITKSQTASAMGAVNLRWTTIEGAKEYQVEIRSPDGRVYNQVAPANSLELKKLMPGPYEFTVNTIDRFGRPSERSPAGQFVVPDTSSLKAPKIKKVNVE